MNTNLRTRSLNEAFKRYQPLPELRLSETGDHGRNQSSIASPALAREMEPSRDPDAARFAQLVAG
jgi:hypothetical protein